MSKLTDIQNEIKAKKSCYNKFGKYNYRKCEDVLEALKPLLKKHDCTLVITDEVKCVGDYTFVESVVSFSEEYDCAEEDIISCAAQAGIEKAGGMALPQAFGSASSYARKYALGAMFLLDDTEDADASNKHGEDLPEEPQMSKEDAIASLSKASTMNTLKAVWSGLPTNVQKDAKVIAAKDEAKRIIEDNT